MEPTEAIEVQLKKYPASSLKDVYKSFFQDEFGPGHILENHSEARIYLKKELGRTESRFRHTAEPCGSGCNFCRLSLDLILDGIVSAEDYFSAFTRGGAEFRLPDITEWKSKWLGILEILKQKSSRFQDFYHDSSMILQKLENGTYIMHHSKIYNQLYDPHYRIFSIDEADRLIRLTG